MKLVFIMLNVVTLCCHVLCRDYNNIIPSRQCFICCNYYILFALCLVCIVPELHLGFHFNKTHFHQCTDTTCSNLLFDVCTDASGCASNQKRNVL